MHTINTGPIHDTCAERRLADYQAAGPHLYKKGDAVKTRFSAPDFDHLPGEWMWVEIIEVGADSITGKLSNDPRFLTHIKCGDPVVVPLDNICQHYSASNPSLN